MTTSEAIVADYEPAGSGQHSGRYRPPRSCPFVLVLTAGDGQIVHVRGWRALIAVATSGAYDPS